MKKKKTSRQAPRKSGKAGKGRNPQSRPVQLDSLSQKEFDEWLAVPENRQAYREMAQRAVLDKNLPRAQRAWAQVCLDKLAEEERMEAVDAKSKQLIRLFEKTQGTELNDALVAEFCRLFDEATELASLIPEPHRSKFINDIAPMREVFHIMKLRQETRLMAPHLSRDRDGDWTRCRRRWTR